MRDFRYLLVFAASMASIAIVYACLFTYQLGAPLPAEYWVREVQIVKEYIAANTLGTKIVVLAGSNGLFGIDSPLMESETGLRAVNLSLHGEMPLDYLIVHAKPALRTGDVLILPLEFKVYFRAEGPQTDGNRYSTWFTNYVMTMDVPYFDNLPLYKQLKFMLSVTSERVLSGVIAESGSDNPTAEQVRRQFRSETEVIADAEMAWRNKEYERPPGVYSIKRMNEHGDFLTHARLTYFGVADHHFSKDFEFNNSFWEALEDLIAYCKLNGILLALSWPASIDDVLGGVNSPPAKDNLARIMTRLQDMDILVLGTPEDFSFKRKYFLDTKYHLNAEGASKRTRKLLEYLAPHLKSWNTTEKRPSLRNLLHAKST